MGYITSLTVPSGVRYAVLPVPDDLFMRIALYAQIEALTESRNWEDRGVGDLSPEQQASLFSAAFEQFQFLESLPSEGGDGLFAKIAEGNLAGSSSFTISRGQCVGFRDIKIGVWGAAASPEEYAYLSVRLWDETGVQITSWRPGASGSIQKIWLGETSPGNTECFVSLRVPQWHEHSGSFFIAHEIMARRQEYVMGDYGGEKISAISIELENAVFDTDSRYLVWGLADV